MYKLSKDHLEIFFGSVRSQGGYNNNPTAHQFKSAYKKILVNAKIKDRGLGNCMALEDIPILNCSSVTYLIMVINNSNCTLNKDIDLEPEQYNFEANGLHLNFELSEFSKEVSLYIDEFVSHKLSSKIKCLICNGALFGNKSNFLYSIISMKDKGGLTYPSDDVMKICVTTEKYLKTYSENHFDKMLVITKIFRSLNNNKLFKSINFQNDQNRPLENHVILLQKAIISIYCDIKFNYMCRKQNETVSLRSWYNKLTIFKCQ